MPLNKCTMNTLPFNEHTMLLLQTQHLGVCISCAAYHVLHIEAWHGHEDTYPGFGASCAGLAVCKPRRAKGKVCNMLSLVVYSRKGPPGPWPLTATEVQAPWIGALPQYS